MGIVRQNKFGFLFDFFRGGRGIFEIDFVLEVFDLLLLYDESLGRMS